VQVKPIQVQDEIKIADLRKHFAGREKKERKDDAGKVAGSRSTASVLAGANKSKNKITLAIPVN